MRILFCAAHACLPGFVAGAGFRNQNFRQAQCGGIAGEGIGRPALSRYADCAWRQYRCLSTHREQARNHARHTRGLERARAPGRDSHQVCPGRARPGFIGADGRAQPGAGHRLGNDPGSLFKPSHGAARDRAKKTPANDTRPAPGRHFRRSFIRTSNPCAER